MFIVKFTYFFAQIYNFVARKPFHFLLIVRFCLPLHPLYISTLINN